jgi:hypothetical protein
VEADRDRASRTAKDKYWMLRPMRSRHDKAEKQIHPRKPAHPSALAKNDAAAPIQGVPACAASNVLDERSAVEIEAAPGARKTMLECKPA